MTVVKQMYKSRKPNISQLIYVWFTISASRRVIMSAFSIVDFIIVFLTQTSSAPLLTNRQPSVANAWNSFFFARTDFFFQNLSHHSEFSTIMYTKKMVKIRTLFDLNFALASPDHRLLMILLFNMIFFLSMLRDLAKVVWSNENVQSVSTTDTGCWGIVFELFSPYWIVL